MTVCIATLNGDIISTAYDVSIDRIMWLASLAHEIDYKEDHVLMWIENANKGLHCKVLIEFNK